MGKLKEKRICINCDKEFKAWSSSYGKYCSLLCQQLFQRKKRIKAWLETGTCNPGSDKGHYVREYILYEQNDKASIVKRYNRAFVKPYSWFDSE